MNQEEFRKELREALKENKSGNKFKSYLATGITLLVIFAGIVGGHYTTKSAVAQNSKDIESQKRVTSAHTEQISGINIQNTEQSTTLKYVKEQMDEVKKDVGKVKEHVSDVNEKMDRMNRKLDRVLTE